MQTLNTVCDKLISMPRHSCKTAFVIAGLAFLAGCDEQPQKNVSPYPEQKTDSQYKWTQVTDSAAFPKSYNFQVFSIRNSLWVMHQAGTWYSLNGKDWVQSSPANVLQNNAFLDYVWFKNALYGLGTFEGNAERYTFTPSISRSTDMRNWQTLAGESNLPKRFFYHPFVFKDKIWIIGGNDGSNAFDDSDNFSDIWNSPDAIHWTRQANDLPFGKRAHSEFVFFKGKMYMLNNDVWASEDALKWVKVTDRIAKEDIFGYAAVVYDDKIWLLGCNRNGKFESQVLVSNDGKAWETQSAPWTPRGAATACIFKSKIIMTGGKYGGLTKGGHTTEFVYSNDVWTLEKR